MTAIEYAPETRSKNNTDLDRAFEDKQFKQKLRREKCNAGASDEYIEAL